MNKLLTALLAGAFALSLGTSAFAADVSKTAEPAKTEATNVVEPIKAADAIKKTEPAKAAKVAKAKPTEAAPAVTEAPAAK